MIFITIWHNMSARNFTEKLVWGGFGAGLAQRNA